MEATQEITTFSVYSNNLREFQKYSDAGAFVRSVTVDASHPIARMINNGDFWGAWQTPSGKVAVLDKTEDKARYYNL